MPQTWTYQKGQNNLQLIPIATTTTTNANALWQMSGRSDESAIFGSFKKSIQTHTKSTKEEDHYCVWQNQKVKGPKTELKEMQIKAKVKVFFFLETSQIEKSVNEINTHAPPSLPLPPKNTVKH